MPRTVTWTSRGQPASTENKREGRNLYPVYYIKKFHRQCWSPDLPGQDTLNLRARNR